jgi:hypothetical protein
MTSTTHSSFIETSSKYAPLILECEKISPALLRDWEKEARVHFDRRKIAPEDQVREIMNCFRKNELLEAWSERNREDWEDRIVSEEGYSFRTFM